MRSGTRIKRAGQYNEAAERTESRAQVVVPDRVGVSVRKKKKKPQRYRSELAEESRRRDRYDGRGRRGERDRARRNCEATLLAHT